MLVLADAHHVAAFTRRVWKSFRVGRCGADAASHGGRPESMERATNRRASPADVYGDQRKLSATAGEGIGYTVSSNDAGAGGAVCRVHLGSVSEGTHSTHHGGAGPDLRTCLGRRNVATSERGTRSIGRTGTPRGTGLRQSTGSAASGARAHERQELAVVPSSPWRASPAADRGDPGAHKTESQGRSTR